MPLEIHVPYDDKVIELEEYVDCVESHQFDFSKQEDIIRSAPYFNQLNNNKNLIVERIANDLKNVQTFQKSNLYGPKVFILFTHPRFFLRAVVWEPVSRLEQSINGFNFDICHDHNFDILTAGYFGPGYDTRTYTYEYSDTQGCLGEKIRMEDERIYSLPEGKIMLYRAKKDIHIQLPPKSLSISLNLIPNTDSIKLPQYQFDESKHTLCRYLQNSGNELMVRMAGALGDESMTEMLENIFESNANRHVSALAAVSLVQLHPAKKYEIEERVLRKDNVLLSDVFKKESAKSGACLGVYQDADDEP